MSSKLHRFIQSRFGASLSQDEARQLIFLIFRTVDWLPNDLRNAEWSRSSLSIEFSVLSIEGLIRDATSDQKESGYWNTVIDDFMCKRIDVDRQFCESLCCTK